MVGHSGGRGRERGREPIVISVVYDMGIDYRDTRPNNRSISIKTTQTAFLEAQLSGQKKISAVGCIC